MSIFKLPFVNWLALNGFAAYYLHIKEGFFWSFSGWMGIIGILIALEAFGWIGASLYYFFQQKTSPNPISPASSLITRGPYRLSRNPLYLAFTSMSLSFALFSHSPYFLASGLVFWLITDLYTIPQEEKFLSERFKEEWANYIQQTRRWL